MKTSLERIALLAATAFAASISQQATAEAPAPNPPAAVIVAPDDPAAASSRRTAESAIAWLGSKLIREVNTSVSSGNPAASVSVCHLKSLPKTGSPIPSMPSVTAVKRTSLRLMDPANAPDAADQQALDFVAKAIERGEPPRDSIVQRVTAADGKIEWRVYRPMAALPECLQCHGDSRTSAPALVAELRQRYPEATAFDYRAGEWRGLIRVSVAPPPAPAKP